MSEKGEESEATRGRENRGWSSSSSSKKRTAERFELCPAKAVLPLSLLGAPLSSPPSSLHSSYSPLRPSLFLLIGSCRNTRSASAEGKRAPVGVEREGVCGETKGGFLKWNARRQGRETSVDSRARSRKRFCLPPPLARPFQACFISARTLAREVWNAPTDLWEAENRSKSFRELRR